MERLTTRLNRMSYELYQAADLVRKIMNVSGTKEEKRKLAEQAWRIILGTQIECDVYRNALEPFVVGDPQNSVCDELRQIKEDLSTTLFLSANGDTKAADELLFNIKERL